MREGRREERETICEETAIIHITKPVMREREREREVLSWRHSDAPTPAPVPATRHSAPAC